jgi:hypothetical protein
LLFGEWELGVNVDVFLFNGWSCHVVSSKRISNFRSALIFVYSFHPSW